VYEAAWRLAGAATIVKGPSATSISDTGRVAPPVHATIAVAATGVRPRPMAAAIWKLSEMPLCRLPLEPANARLVHDGIDRANFPSARDLTVVRLKRGGFAA
jgi:hypothetical protein